MFNIHCPGHGREVLLWPRQYEVHNTDAGILVHWHCSCGTTGWLRTGLRPAAAA